MPFFSVTTISRVEKKVVVEAENMGAATQRACNAICNDVAHTRESALYFEELVCKKIPDGIDRRMMVEMYGPMVV